MTGKPATPDPFFRREIGLGDSVPAAPLRLPQQPPAAPRQPHQGNFGRGMQSLVDAAQDSPDNIRHWAGTDSLAADWAYDPMTRWRLRNRSRHEAVNNCYAKGVVRSAADDMIGTGPRLQITIPIPKGGDEEAWDEAIDTVEQNFQRWMDATRLALNLRRAEKSIVRDGECFGVFDTDENLDHPVKFDIRWMEAEQCGSPYGIGSLPGSAGGRPFTPDNNHFLIDGIMFDRFGKPIEYFFYTLHPGSFFNLPVDTETVPARRVIHLYSPDRFGQHRGIPALTPALPIYAQTRRLTLATLTAAEFAAVMAGILKTNLPPNSGVPQPVEAWSLFEVVRGALMALPEGWDMGHMESKHPNAEYGAFKRELLNETGRATSMPLNVVTGNSSGYNFSSGRLDHLPYQRGIRIERNDRRLTALEPIFREWYREALLVGQIPIELPPLAAWKLAWNWDGFDSIDQNKDATADDTRIKNGTQTYHETYSAYGQDWVEQFEQMAREKRTAEKLGLPWPVLSNAPSSAAARAPAADNMPQAVAMALAEAGVPDDVQAEVLDALGPTFAAMQRARAAPSLNGHSRIGGAT